MYYLLHHRISEAISQGNKNWTDGIEESILFSDEDLSKIVKISNSTIQYRGALIADSNYKILWSHFDTKKDKWCTESVINDEDVIEEATIIKEGVECCQVRIVMFGADELLAVQTTNEILAAIPGSTVEFLQDRGRITYAVVRYFIPAK